MSKDRFLTSGTEPQKNAITEFEYKLQSDKQHYEHERQLQKNQFDQEEKLKNLDLGLLGKLIGNRENAPQNIALLVCLGSIVVLLLSVKFFYPNDNDLILKIIDTVVPLITLTLGYLFGKN